MFFIALLLLHFSATNIFAFKLFNETVSWSVGVEELIIPYGAFSLKADTPEVIDIKFYLFNRLNKTEPFLITNRTIPSDFDPKIALKFVVHGFIDVYTSDWLNDIASNILQIENANVVLVDWYKGNRPPYFHAFSNTKVVGAQIALLVNYLVEDFSLDAKNVHIIGHSLGAHIAGFAGKLIKNLGRITGLDPAGPYFRGSSKTERLDLSDALFVDNIHTDGGITVFSGYGLSDALGHVDFYPNGGQNQPGCNVIKDRASCSHGAAYKYFIESIKSNRCRFYGFKCSSKEEFDEGKCFNCSEHGCNQMGYWASPDKDLGSLYLNTEPVDSSLVCQQYFVITFHSYERSDNVSLTKASGILSIQFESESQQTSISEVKGVRFVSLGSVNNDFVSFKTALNEDIKSVNVYFSKSRGFFFDSYDGHWGFKFIEIFDPVRRLTKKFCPSETFIENNSYVKFILC